MKHNFVSTFSREWDESQHLAFLMKRELEAAKDAGVSPEEYAEQYGYTLRWIDRVLPEKVLAAFYLVETMFDYNIRYPLNRRFVCRRIGHRAGESYGDPENGYFIYTCDRCFWSMDGYY